MVIVHDVRCCHSSRLHLGSWKGTGSVQNKIVMIMKTRQKLSAVTAIVIIAMVTVTIVSFVMLNPQNKSYRATRLDERAGFTPYKTLSSLADFTAVGIWITTNGTSVKCPKLGITNSNLAAVLGLSSVAGLNTTRNNSRVFWGSMIGTSIGLYGIVFMVNTSWYINTGVPGLIINSTVATTVEL
jgi:hypothetical protein